MATGRNERLKPVHRDRLADQAHGAIREAIITGKFDTGERLIETRLAADLGMSRAPVREAIQRLAEEGLVTEHPHQGTFVTILTADDVVDFYNVRLGIETTAVRLFMRRACSTEPLRPRSRPCLGPPLARTRTPSSAPSSSSTNHLRGERQRSAGAVVFGAGGAVDAGDGA